MKKKSKRKAIATSFSLLADQIKFIKALAEKQEVSTSKVIRDFINEKMVS